MNRPIDLLAIIVASGMLTSCGDIDENLMVGTLERDRIELKVESSEPIVEISVEDGQIVATGEVILQQDTTRHRARLDQVSAQRDQAAARLAELRRGPREEAIREAQARLEASEVLTVNAKADLERAREIFERGLSNQSDLDDAQTAFQATSARERGDREALSSLLHGTTIEELQQAQAVLNAAEAVVQLAQLNLERLQITVPVAGVIDKVLYEVGERPSPGTTVAILLDNSRNFARIYVPEHLKVRVRPGDRLEVSVDGIEADLNGTVRWVSSDASFTPYFALTEHDRSRLSYLAEVDLEGAENLPSGMPLQARVPGLDED
jgi:HlyD family secretion protein